jgi:hypothetical protein
LFLIIVLVGANALLQVADDLLFKAVGVGPFLSSAVTVYALVAIELVWIALLE